MKIPVAVGMMAALGLVLLVPSVTEGLVLTRCEMEQKLNQTLPANSTMANDAAQIVCFAESASGLNTSKVSQRKQKPADDSSAEVKPSKGHRKSRSLKTDLKHGSKPSTDLHKHNSTGNQTGHHDNDSAEVKPNKGRKPRALRFDGKVEQWRSSGSSGKSGTPQTKSKHDKNDKSSKHAKHDDSSESSESSESSKPVTPQPTPQTGTQPQGSTGGPQSNSSAIFPNSRKRRSLKSNFGAEPRPNPDKGGNGGKSSKPDKHGESNGSSGKSGTPQLVPQIKPKPDKGGNGGKPSKPNKHDDSSESRESGESSKPVTHKPIPHTEPQPQNSTLAPQPVPQTGIQPQNSTQAPHPNPPTGTQPPMSTGGPLGNTSATLLNVRKRRALKSGPKPDGKPGAKPGGKPETKPGKDDHVHPVESSDDATFYGVLQLSDRFACASGNKTTLNLCGLTCDKLIDDDITDDIACFRTLLNNFATGGSVKGEVKESLEKLYRNFQKQCASLDSTQFFSAC